MNFKRMIGGLLCATTILSMTACGGAGNQTGAETGNNTTAAVTPNTTQPEAGEPQYGGTLKIATPWSTTSPGYTPENTSNASLTLLVPAYESLLTYNEEGELETLLADSYETNPEEPSITWKLKSGITFADGTPFNADAVKVNIEEYQKTGRSEVGGIDHCEVIDDTTVKMVLTNWNSAMVESVGFFVLYMSPTALKDVDSLRTTSCGTGPFQVSEYNPGVVTKFTKNENYWQEGKPYLDSVEMYTVNENTTMSSAFQAGEYDIVHLSDLTIGQQLMSNQDYIFERNTNGQGLVSTGLIPNSADENSPFADVRVRQAMCYAIDEDALVDAFGYGLLTTTNQWAAPGSLTYSDDVQGYPYNPEKAKELLEEAGYPDGFDTMITMTAGTKDMFTAAANMLSEVGIRCEINLVDDATQSSLYATGWEGIMGHFASVAPDLGLYMGRHLGENAAYYGCGIQHPEDAMQMLEDIRTAKTEEEKLDLEHKMQVLIYDDYALFGKPLFIQLEPNFKHNYVIDDNLSLHHVNIWTPADCWLNK